MANPAFPRPDMPGPQPVAGTKVTTEAVQRTPLLRSSGGEGADRVFKWAMTACGLAVLGVLFLIVYELMSGSRLTWHAFGFKFFAGTDWNPVSEQFGALPFIYGTLVSSLLALVIAVPLSVGVAVFTTEMCPKALRGPLSFFMELLAAIPSVIYGLWASICAGATLERVCSALSFENARMDRALRRPSVWYRHASGGNGSVDHDHSHYFLDRPRGAHGRAPASTRGSPGLRATRWEMIRVGVLRNARAGIVGGIILGLGRALGETIAVTMVIGNRPEIAKSLFAPGYTMASVLANEFSEATGDVYLSALVEIGLALFMVTIIVNALAQLLVWTVTRGQPARGNV